MILTTLNVAKVVRGIPDKDELSPTQAQRGRLATREQFHNVRVQQAMNSVDLSLVQRFSSRVLWHFTGYGKTQDQAYAILNTILRERKLRVASSPEPLKMDGGNERFGYPIACMCDIPFQDLRIHMIRYGEVGIAFHKGASIQLGNFNPVLYVHRESILYRHASGLLSKIEDMLKEGDKLYDPIQEFLRAIGSYTKRCDLLHPAAISPEKDKSQDNNFYYEREWRTVHDWTFDDTHIAAIMIPNVYVSDFRREWNDRFPVSSIISSEMVGAL